MNELMMEMVIAFLIVAGSLFMLIGSFALIKLPDLMTRIHGPTKATTLGVGAILAASICFIFNSSGKVSINELLIILFLFGTAPVSAHFISRAFLHMQCSDPESKMSEKLPGTACPVGWSMLEPVQDSAEQAQG